MCSKLIQSRGIPPADSPNRFGRARTPQTHPIEQRDHLPHAFALLRGLTIDALVSKYWSLMASSALTPPTPTILPLEIASVYASIKSAFSDALRHELRRAERDNQTILAAGRGIGEDNDAVLKFKHNWIDPGLCTEAGQQLIL